MFGFNVTNVSFYVPITGIEPARLSTTVSKTAASTYSATRAISIYQKTSVSLQ